jgi:hypothetical protein
VNEFETLYSRERRLVEDHRILALVLLPEYVGIASNVRNWMPAHWGEWRLADVWLDSGDDISPAPAKNLPANSGPDLIPGSRP